MLSRPSRGARGAREGDARRHGGSARVANSVNSSGFPERANSEPPPQHEAFGRYALLEKIGQGGMAEVFRAKSYGVEGFEKVLVIKRILPQLAREPKFVEMFV